MDSLADTGNTDTGTDGGSSGTGNDVADAGDGSSGTNGDSSGTNGGSSGTNGGSSDNDDSSGAGTGDESPGGGSSVIGGTNSAPKIEGTPETLVYEQDEYGFTPVASDPDGDPLSFEVENAPAWLELDSRSGRLSGRPGATDVGVHSDIRVSVTDGSATASLPSFDITVKGVSDGSFTLSWQPPTQNIDDTPLTNLDGFNIYWGTSPGDYTSSVTVDNEGTTSRFFEGLETGTYYFAVAAFNTQGTESAISDHATIVVR